MVNKKVKVKNDKRIIFRASKELKELIVHASEISDLNQSVIIRNGVRAEAEKIIKLIAEETEKNEELRIFSKKKEVCPSFLVNNMYTSF